MADFAVIGQSVYRKDANSKVTGQVLHVGNIEMPAMLHVAVLRSPYAHARIRRIEKSKAEALNSVAIVLTGAEVAQMPGVDPYFGPAFRDQPILAVDKVCFVGDPVIAVAAKDRRTAEDALQLVEVDYEPLPAILDLLEAVKPESPLVHEQHRPAKAFADLAHVKAGQKSNICYQFKLRRGDVDKAFAAADRVFEDTFSSPPAQHLPMEPHVTLVYLDENKRPNVWIDSYCVYTNHVPAGAFRGFGVPQVIWAYDSQMDIVARAIGADPVEFRLRHALNEGKAFATGTPVKSFGIKEAIRQASKAIEWSKPRIAPAGSKRRGKGIAAGVKAVLTPSISGAIVMMNADGTVNVLSSTVEMGQGSETMMGQIVAEELGVSFDQVHVVQPDTDITPYETITAGSRSTYHMGNAVRAAAGKIKAELFQVVAKKLEVNRDDLVAQRGRIFVRGTEERGMTISEAFLAKFGSLGTTLTGEAICQPEAIPTDPGTGQSEKCTEYWFPSATTAEVEVDTDTGQVKILQFYSVGDTGTAINPKHCEQQLLGSAITHLGLTLFEEM